MTVDIWDPITKIWTREVNVRKVTQVEHAGTKGLFIDYTSGETGLMLFIDDSKRPWSEYAKSKGKEIRFLEEEKDE